MAKVISLAEKRARSLPQKGETWFAAARRAPVWIHAEDKPPQRPWAVMVVAPEMMQIRRMELVEEPPTPEHVLDQVMGAMGKPMAGARGKYRPTRVAVEDPELAAFLKPRLKALGVRTSRPGRLPEIDDLLLHLEGSMSGRDPVPGLLESGDVTEADMELFFHAADRFYRVAPWRELHDADVLAVRCPPQAPPWYAAVMGAGGQVFGLSLYRTLADLERLWETEGEADGAAVLRSVALWYSTQDEVPFADLDALEGKDWPVAGPQAYPVAVRMDPDDGHGRPDREQLAMLTAALEGVARFSEQFTDENHHPDPVVVPGLGGQEVAVELLLENEHGVLEGSTETVPIEAFVDGWHWDEESHEFAREAGSFLLAFLVHHLFPMGLAEPTWRRHEENIWHIGMFATRAAAGQEFTPTVFAGPPRFEAEFGATVSPAATRLKGYRSTWNHLQRYLGSLRETSLF